MATYCWCFFCLSILACENGKEKFASELYTHVGIAHTRWATHGVPSEVNSHPQRSDNEHSFVVVHNGIITNYKDVKNYLESKGHTFESETDTEIIAKLIYHLYRKHPNYSFRELVEQVIQQLVSAFRPIHRVRKLHVRSVANQLVDLRLAVLVSIFCTFFTLFQFIYNQRIIFPLDCLDVYLFLSV